MDAKFQQSLDDFTAALIRFRNAFKGKEMPQLTAEVMNGTVTKGDTIAYAVRWGSSLDMHIAEVLEVKDVPKFSWSENPMDTKRVLSVWVFRSTNSWALLPRKAQIEVLDRVVKM